jgi:hypothetical protein
MSRAAAAAGDVRLRRAEAQKVVTRRACSVLVRLFTAFSQVLKPDVKDAFVQVRQLSSCF